MKNSSAVFSCAILGDGSLLRSCLELLIKNNFSIKLIILNSNESDLINDDLVGKYKISFDPGDILNNKKIGYLFSIGYKKKLPDNILKKTIFANINYHNSLLPKYAGSNAISWMIINNEKSGGVTWHIMDKLIDGGAILEQTSFKITKKDNAEKLLLKCHDLAIKSFARLLDNIKIGNVNKTNQNINNRTFFKNDLALPNNGQLNWNDSKNTILRNIRATQYEAFENEFGLFWFHFDDNKHYVLNAEESINSYNHMLGTVADIEDEYITVAVGDGFVKLKAYSLNKFDFSCHSIHKNPKLTIGSKLSSTISQSKNIIQPKYLYNIQQHFVTSEIDFLISPMISKTKDKSYCLTTTISSKYNSHSRVLNLILRILEKYSINIENSIIVHHSGRNYFIEKHSSRKINLSPVPENIDLLLIMSNKYSSLAISNKLIKPIHIIIGKYNKYHVQDTTILFNIDKSSIRVSFKSNDHGSKPYFKILLNSFKHDLIKKPLHIYNNNLIKLHSSSDILSGLMNNIDNKKGYIYSHKNDPLNYSELLFLINTYTNALIKFGVKKGDLVLLRCENNIFTISSLIAMINLGIIFCPIHKNISEYDLAHITEESSAKFLLDVQRLTLEINILDSSKPIKHKKSFKKNDVICILFTSGTTGIPKGVLCTRSGLNNRLKWMIDDLSFSSDNSFIHKTPLTFDVSLWEWLIPIFLGANLYIYPQEFDYDYSILNNNLKETVNGVVHFVPSIFLDYVSTSKSSKYKDISHVIFSGETLENRHFDLASSIFPNARIFNFYGPTEASIDVTYFECKKNSYLKPLIGQVTPGTKIIIVDKDFNLCKIGVKGQILISGICLCHGYINKNHNKNRFIHLDNNGNKSVLYYITGDYGRWINQGDIEYLGRIDRTIKLNGNRIDLDGVEEAINKIDCVINSAVTYHNEKIYLFIKVTTHTNQDLIAKKLIHGINGKFIPAITFIDDIPLTSSGKKDYRNLLLAHGTKKSGKVNIPEVDSAFKLISGINEYTPADCLSYLVPNSLSVLRLINSINSYTNVEISFEDYYSFKTVSDLISFIQNKKSDEFAKLQNNSFRQHAYLPLPLNDYQLKILNHEKHLNISDSYLLAYELSLNSRSLDETNDKIKELFTKLDIFHYKLSLSNSMLIPHPEWIHQISVENESSVRISFFKSFGEDYKNNGVLFKINLFKENGSSKIIIGIHHMLIDHQSIDLIISNLLLKLDNRETINISNETHYASSEGIQSVTNEFIFPEISYLNKLEKVYSTNKRFKSDLVMDKKINMLVYSLEETYNLHDYFLAIFFITLFLYFGENEIIVFCPISDRSRLKKPSVIGYLNRLVPIRINFKNQSTILDLISDIRCQINYHMMYIITESYYQYRFDQYPIFALEDYRGILNLMCPGQTIKQLIIRNVPRSNYSFSVELNKNIAIKAEYSDKYLDDELSNNLNKSYLYIIEQSLSDLHKPINSFEIYNNQELEKQKNTVNKYYDLKSIIYSSIIQNTDKLAISFLDYHYSYSLIGKKAKIISDELAKIHFNVVALYVENSAELIACVLACILSDKIFAIIDYKNNPVRYIETCLEQLPEHCVLCDIAQVDKFSLYQIYTNLNDNLTLIAPTHQPIFSLENLANYSYIGFTSGTTGLPKSILIGKNALSLLLTAQHDLFNLNNTDNVLQFSNPGFDAFIWDFLYTLLSGATLFIPNQSLRLNADYLENFIYEYNITLATLPPSIIRQLTLTDKSKMKILCTAGEAPKKSDFNNISDHIKIVNAYGLTETTVCASYTKDYNPDTQPNNIGSPINDNKIYITNTNKKLVPPYTVGFICINGSCLASGILKNGELAPLAFDEIYIKNTEIKLFNTGDLGYKSSDNSIVYYGRINTNPIIGGYRIDIRYLEKILLSYSIVRQAIAKIFEQANHFDKHLVAFVVVNVQPFQNQNSIISTIFTHISNLIPKYYLPEKIIILEQFPLKSNGKIDDEELYEQYLKNDYNKIHNCKFDTEDDIIEALLMLWERCLSIKIDFDTNFMDTELSSLHIASFAYSLDDYFPIHIKPSDCFKFPNIRLLANYIYKNLNKVK